MAVEHNNPVPDSTGSFAGEDYESLLDDYSHFAPPAEGEVLQGKVLKVTAKDVIVDFGYKSEGLVPIEQFIDASGTVTVHAGDVVDVMVDHGERPEGYVLLSHVRGKNHAAGSSGTSADGGRVAAGVRCQGLRHRHQPGSVVLGFADGDEGLGQVDVADP